MLPLRCLPSLPCLLLQLQLLGASSHSCPARNVPHELVQLDAFAAAAGPERSQRHLGGREQEGGVGQHEGVQGMLSREPGHEDSM
eukprot:1155834-Pelagomonas_calceolata.AAC.2